MQWSFGVTCWEIFSGGKTPYPGVDPLSLIQLLENGQRLDKPLNAACTNTMYVCSVDISLYEQSMNHILLKKKKEKKSETTHCAGRICIRGIHVDVVFSVV